MGYEGVHEARPRGEIRIVPLQLLLQERVIRRDMLIAEPVDRAEL